MNVRLASVVLGLAAGGLAVWSSCIPVPLPIPTPIPSFNDVPAEACDGGTATIQVLNNNGACNLIVSVEGSARQFVAPDDTVTFAATHAGTYGMDFSTTTTGCEVRPSSCSVVLECGKEDTVWANDDPPGSASTRITCP